MYLQLEIIYKYLKSLNINGLAAFKNGPAIFLDQAPDDSDSRWNGSQYGRIIYGLNLKDDSERKVSGTMEIAVAYLFDNKGYSNLLEAKNILKKAFEGVFLTDADTTISLVWRKTESFQAGKRCCFVALRNWKGPYRDRDCFSAQSAFNE